MTFAKVDTGQTGTVKIEGELGTLVVRYDPAVVSVAVKEYDTRENKLRIASKYPVLRRIAFVVKDVKEKVTVGLTIEPVR